MSAAARVALERIALEEGPSATNTDSLLGNRDHCALHGDVRRPARWTASSGGLTWAGIAAAVRCRSCARFQTSSAYFIAPIS